ncbi:MAG: outer membrane lipoprotein carrier protein LolA [Casimicrobiaceae bacterium]
MTRRDVVDRAMRRMAARAAIGAWLRSLAAGLLLAASIAPARAFDLADLAAVRQRVTESSARFIETRHVAALSAPIVRAGTLRYRRPDHLQMSIVTPRAEELVIDGSTLHLRTPAGERTLALDSEPLLLAWTESVRATLAGDIPALSKYFAPSLSGTAGNWKLELVPRGELLRAQIALIVIEGGGDAVRRIEMREAGGDDAVMDITVLAGPQ